MILDRFSNIIFNELLNKIITNSDAPNHILSSNLFLEYANSTDFIDYLPNSFLCIGHLYLASLIYFISYWLSELYLDTFTQLEA